MTNATLSQALAIVLALTDEDKRTLTQTLVAMSGRATVSAPTALAQETVSQSAPTQTRKHIDYDELKANAEVKTVNIRALKGAITLEYVGGAANKCAKRRLKDAGFTWDGNYELPETYAKDYTDKDGNVHKAGTHKHGAWVWGGSARAFTNWCKLNKALCISVDELNAQYDKQAARQARKESKAQ